MHIRHNHRRPTGTRTLPIMKAIGSQTSTLGGLFNSREKVTVSTLKLL